MEHIFRIFDFNVYNQTEMMSSDDEDKNKYQDNSIFEIQIFGINEKGESCSIIAKDYKPFFYIKVGDNWTIQMKDGFLAHIKDKIGKYYANCITDCKIIKRKKLYGFDNGKEHKFIKLEFTNISSFNKTKNLWYSSYDDGYNLLKHGYNFYQTETKIYESNIPPLLRFFHIKEISPSGWIGLPKKKTLEIKGDINKKSNCNYEYEISYKNIIALNGMETRVPYKICSFDIEASSSHGDFPLPVKSYKKLANNIIDFIEKNSNQINEADELLSKIILTAFGFDTVNNIDLVYPKQKPSLSQVKNFIEKWLADKVRNFTQSHDFNDVNKLEQYFDKMSNDDDEGDFDEQYKKKLTSYKDKKASIKEIIFDKDYERENKINDLNISLNKHFPKLEGDKVTFIGSTFMNYGQKEPFMNHCIVLDTCAPIESETENTIIESYKTEKEVLLAWQKLIQRENPDMIIGYNIFGFDYQFMFKRAEENDCVEEFLQLSRNKEEICGTINKDTGKYKIEESSIKIASGQHDLNFIKMNGRLQVDLYNFYRRESNLTSYKLDYVAGHFIGDFVKKINSNASKNQTEIFTSNMTGLLVGSYIHIEEIGHSVEYYKGGSKFIVISIDKENKSFIIDADIDPDFNKKVRWCLAKDDVSPKDIFKLSNGSSEDRAIVAKYCIQDCNLVHYLFNKSDILTGFIEMAKICSVPINFLVMRGQGIKLTSFIAKKCRDKRTLMPVIEKGMNDEGYEGAIVLDPKCDLYLDNPVACVDYASLYPSSMISENLSHDSKVWTKEYNLDGKLIE
jgi:DNA polymerase elongation subunit (family B)